MRAVAEWSLPGGYALGVMPGLASQVTGGDRHLAAIFGLVLGKGLTDSVRMFGEIGFEQLDAAFSLGVTEAAPDVAFTVGFSTLFPGGR